MKTISAEELDRKFDDGEDISEYLDWSQARRQSQESARVEFDLPAAVLRKLDAEALRLGISRQSLVEKWITERLALAEQR